jgi:hypothetical protein
MTISPPPNVNEPTYQVLASGIDSLLLSLDVTWLSDDLFHMLSDLKAKAAEAKGVSIGYLSADYGAEELAFEVKGHGSQGYEWLLNSNEYDLNISKSLIPFERPGIVIRIRAETLWRLGSRYAVDRILALLVEAGARIESTKISRLDLCLDLLVPENLWSPKIMDFVVTRAIKDGLYMDRRKMTGQSIGKGNFMARLYDKPLEIASVSHKDWMYIIWGIGPVPEGRRIIRIEFQMRREALKELSINTLDDLWDKERNLWAYCTHDWLKFQDRPGCHSNQRNTLDWWRVVQNGYQGSQAPEPLIRAKAFSTEERQIMAQLTGLTISLLSLIHAKEPFTELNPLSVQAALDAIALRWKRAGINDNELLLRTLDRHVRYQRSKAKASRAKSDRTRLGFDTELPPFE